MLALSRAEGVRAAESFYAEFVLRPLRFAPPAPIGRRDRVLITAPHCAAEPSDRSAPELRDPHSGAIADRMRAQLRSADVDATVVKARLHRRRGDQNRLSGLFAAMDMAPTLRRYREGQPRGSLARVLHVDVHTYTAHRPAEGWGSGLNIIVLHGSPAHAALARGMSRRIRDCTVVEMDRRPASPADDTSNALMEWSSAHGALSVLLEFPVRRREAGCALDACWDATEAWRVEQTVDALVRALSGPREGLF